MAQVRTSQGRFTIFKSDDRLVGLMLSLGTRSHQDVDACAARIRDRASQMAPRLTGSLAASLYVSGPNDSDYSQRANAARSLNHDAKIVPEVTPEQALSFSGGSSKGYTVVVGVAVEHGIFNELGTRFMAPQPFLTPAVEPERERFIASMKTVADG